MTLTGVFGSFFILILALVLEPELELASARGVDMVDTGMVLSAGVADCGVAIIDEEGSMADE